MAKWFTRGKTEDRESMAAMALDITDSNDLIRLQTYIAADAKSDSQAWRWHDGIPEVNYAIGRKAKLAGHAKIIAVERKPDGTPGDPVDVGLPNDIATSLYSPYGGVRRLIASYMALRSISGDMHLVENRGDNGMGKNEPDGYDFCSSSELIVEGKSVSRVTLPNALGSDAFTIDMKPDQYLGRVWNPSFRFVEVAVSPLDALSTICEELHLLTLGIKSRLLNRLTLSGILFIPSEMSEIVPVNMGVPGQDLTTYHNDKVINGLVLSMMKAVANHEDPKAALPIIIRGAGEHGEKIRWITMPTDIIEADMKLREESVRRILTGLDCQPETVTGMGDANHWDAWAIMGQDVKLNTEPDLQDMMWALNRLVFWPKIMEAVDEGTVTFEPGEFMLWYDLSDASTPTNLAENARQASDRGAIGSNALRVYSGVREEDAPSELDMVRWAGMKVGNPYLMLEGTKIQKTIDWEEADKHGGRNRPGPGSTSEGTPSPAGPGVGDPGSPGDNESDRPKSETPN